MTEEEKLEWYDSVYEVLEDELDENEDLIIVRSYYWIDEIYKNMDFQTQNLCKVAHNEAV